MEHKPHPKGAKESRGRLRTSSVSIALWNYANDLFDRKAKYGCLKKHTIF